MHDFASTETVHFLDINVACFFQIPNDQEYYIKTIKQQIAVIQ